MKSPDDQRRLLRLVPFLFLVHAIEGAVRAGPTLEAARTGYPKWFRLVVPPVTIDQFAVALLVMVLLSFAVLRWGEISRPRGWGGYLLMGIQAALLLNVGVIIVAAWMLQGYAAGCMTAVLVQLPFSLILFTRAWKRGWISGHGLLLLIPASLLLRGPIFFAFLFLAGFVLRLAH